MAQDKRETAAPRLWGTGPARQPKVDSNKAVFKAAYMNDTTLETMNLDRVENRAHAYHSIESMIQRSAVADLHAHEVGSAAVGRIGRDILQAAQGNSKPQMRRIAAGLAKVIAKQSQAGAKSLRLQAVREGDDGLRTRAVPLTSATGAKEAHGQIRIALRALETLRRATTPELAERVERSVRGAITEAAAIGETMADKPQRKVRRHLALALSALDDRAERGRSAVDDAIEALSPLAPGLINIMHDSMQTLIAAKPGSVRASLASRDLQEAVDKVRNLASISKPDSTTFDQAHLAIDAGAEFFQRYKDILGTLGGAMDGAGIAEVARGRGASSNEQVAYQELRADLDVDRYSRVFDPTHPDGMRTMDELATEARSFVENLRGTNAFMVYSLTKREVAAPPGADASRAEEAKNEAPAFADQAAAFVRAFFDGGPANYTPRAEALQGGIVGLDHGGRESAARAPMLFMAAHAQRVIYNTSAVRHAARDVEPAALRQLLGDDVYGRWMAIDEDAAAQGRWQLSANDRPLATGEGTADLQAALAGVVEDTPGDWRIELRGKGNEAMSVEELAATNRKVHDFLRGKAAESNQLSDIPQLGASIHAGEQIRSVSPEVLLDQIDQVLALGTDRIGHGVILGTPIQLLYRWQSDGLFWPTSVEASKIGDPAYRHLAKTKPEITAMDDRRCELLDRVIQRGVTIEVNLTSNLVISDQTVADHCLGVFAARISDGLRFSISTDDETILDTSAHDELRKAAKGAKLPPVHAATLILEGFDRRLSGRSVNGVEEMVSKYQSILTDALFVTDERENLTVADALAVHFGVDTSGLKTAEAILERTLRKVFT